ncbi:MAG: hypothetical protein ACRDXX_17675 [Stackebrandtia sp.]
MEEPRVEGPEDDEPAGKRPSGPQSKLDAPLRAWLPAIVGALAVALLLGVGVSRVVAPVPADDGAAGEHSGEQADGGHMHGPSGDAGEEVADVPGGLSASEAGYTLVAERLAYADSEEPQEWAFTVETSDGEAATDFAVVHDKPMHLFAVRRDLFGYQHLHPSLDAETGVWRVETLFDHPGEWRMIADFTVVSGDEETPLTLGVDVSVPGDYDPRSPSDSTPDGFAVSVEFSPEAGVSQPLLVSVAADGEPAELEPYLGAKGHLAILRESDLGFLHVHPDDEGVGDAMRFWAAVPSTGAYVAYLDFKVDGTVHTAVFTFEV